jgi:FkbM family methyltransferase
MCQKVEVSVSVRDGLKAYYEGFGIRGICAISLHRMIGRPKELTAQPAGISHPVHLRIRTSDVSLYHDLLLGGEYAMELPFSPLTIVDAGANAGIAALYYANKYPAATIVAVEPEPSNFQALVRNCQEYPNIVPVQAALWDVDGEVHLGQTSEVPASQYNKWAFQVADKGFAVRAITMSTLMAETGIETIDLLKMDIEGAEKEVFESAEWMNRVSAVAIELHDQIKPGCRLAVEARTKGWKAWQRGEIAFFVRY